MDNTKFKFLFFMPKNKIKFVEFQSTCTYGHICIYIQVSSITYHAQAFLQAQKISIDQFHLQQTKQLPIMASTRTSSPEVQPPRYGNLITVLSIDGGGIRGIIPGVLLAYLESQLQVRYISSYILAGIIKSTLLIIYVSLIYIYRSIY